VKTLDIKRIQFIIDNDLTLHRNDYYEEYLYKLRDLYWDISCWCIKLCHRKRTEQLERSKDSWRSPL